MSTISLHAADQVRVAGGALEGTAGSQPGIRAFLVIPYALPPVGAWRWKAPGPAPKWTGVRKADKFGNHCMQTTPFADMVYQGAESEDCLYLNVFTPVGASDFQARLPVMVWIHGGGYFAGSGDEPRHDGSVLASKGVIVVTINYRLGVFGFLAHPELTAESSHKVSGNYGLLDQIAALRWVHDNIAAFGGDASKVTIFGESAGSASVSAMVATPLTKGLFARAIGESGAHFGAPGGTLNPVSMAEAETRGAKLAGTLGAKSLTELRAVPAAALVKATTPNPSDYWPNVDGYVFPEDPWDIYAQGKQNHVALLAGWNSAEAKSMARDMNTPETLNAALKKQFPGNEAAALKAYPAGSDAHQTWLSAVALASDNFISYSTWKWIEVQTATGQAPVYRYLFDHVIPTATGDAPADDPGAAHATDIEYVFGTMETKKLAWRDSDRKVSALMLGYWTNFAKTGNPNGPGLAEWPVYNAKSRQVMRLNVSPKAEAETNRARYELQDARTVELRKK